MTLLGYARVSTADQNPELQEHALRAAGCERIWMERAGGKSSNRAELNDLLAYARHEDTLVVWKLDRLGRNLSHLVTLLADLNARGVEFRSLTEAIDTTTAAGRMYFHMFATLAEFEREVMLERTRSGLAVARAQGRLGGGKPKLSQAQIEEALRMRGDGRSYLEIAAILRVHRTTLHRALQSVKAA